MAHAGALITTGSSLAFMAGLASEGMVVIPHDMPTIDPWGNPSPPISLASGQVAQLADGFVSLVSHGMRLEHDTVRDYYDVPSVAARLEGVTR